MRKLLFLFFFLLLFSDGKIGGWIFPSTLMAGTTDLTRGIRSELEKSQGAFLLENQTVAMSHQLQARKKILHLAQKMAPPPEALRWVLANEKQVLQTTQKLKKETLKDRKRQEQVVLDEQRWNMQLLSKAIETLKKYRVSSSGGKTGSFEKAMGILKQALPDLRQAFEEQQKAAGMLQQKFFATAVSHEEESIRILERILGQLSTPETKNKSQKQKEQQGTEMNNQSKTDNSSAQPKQGKNGEKNREKQQKKEKQASQNGQQQKQRSQISQNSQQGRQKSRETKKAVEQSSQQNRQKSKETKKAVEQKTSYEMDKKQTAEVLKELMRLQQQYKKEKQAREKRYGVSQPGRVPVEKDW